jgi:hypothetical protein
LSLNLTRLSLRQEYIYIPNGKNPVHKDQGSKIFLTKLLFITLMVVFCLSGIHPSIDNGTAICRQEYGCFFVSEPV